MLIGLLGLLTSAASRALSDTLTFGINLAVMTNIVQFVHSTTVESRKQVEPAWRKWGPFFVVTFASVASMVGISRQIMLDSNTAALRKTDGSKGAFNFDACSYTAMATAHEGVSQTDACPAEPIAVVQAGALNPAMNAILNSAAMDTVCYYCSWSTMIFTIVGFMWLSNTVPWMQAKWKAARKDGLAKALLETESCTAAMCQQQAAA